MAIELKVPSVGESIYEVTIGEWLKREGDYVAKDEALVALETDKASLELPAPAGGTLKTQIKKVEGGAINEDLRVLPCVKRFQVDARGLLGDSAYDKLAIEAAWLEDLEDIDGPGLED